MLSHQVIAKIHYISGPILSPGLQPCPAAQFFELPDPEGGCKTARNDQKSTVRLALCVCRLRGKGHGARCSGNKVA